MKIVQFLSTACALFSFTHFVAMADTFPSKPIKVIVPYAAGGTADFMVRLMAKQLSATGGLAITVDNRSGASGWIGAELMARAPADGYTIGVLSSVFAATPFVSKPPFEPRDLQTITLLASVPGLLSVNAAVPVYTLNDLLALAKAKPGQLSFGHAGSLGAGHLAMEMLKLNNNVDIISIAYKGGAPALNDLLGGQIQMSISGPTAHLPFIKPGGKLRAIATTGLKRSTAVPDLPTMAESGQPGFEINEWYGLFAPEKTPRDIVERLNREFVKALSSPEVRASLVTVGAEFTPNTSEEFKVFFTDEMNKLGKLISKLNLKGD